MNDGADPGQSGVRAPELRAPLVPPVLTPAGLPVAPARVPQVGVHADYFPFFDYLRILLALGVFAAHADYNDSISDEVAQGCVQVFFALSGFLIGGILLGSQPRDLPRFYYNRLTRIWIPYAVALFFLIGAAVARGQLHDGKMWEFAFFKATFVYNLFGPPQLATQLAHMPLQGTGNHFWSICVEEQFYLLAPLVLVVFRSLRVPVLLALVLANSVLPHTFAAISLGVLFAISKERWGTWYLSPRGTAISGGLLALATAAWLTGLASFDHMMPYISVALIALLARPGRQLPFGAILGGISYPFYLNHWLGLFVRKTIDRKLNAGMLVATLGALVVSLGVSLVLYLAIDRQVLARRARWFTPRRGLIAAASGFSLVAIGLVVGFLLTLRAQH